MSDAFDEKVVSEIVGKVIQGERVEAAARLTSALVTVLTISSLGPGAIVLGGASDSTIRAVAKFLADNATARMITAGEKFDREREQVQVLVDAIVGALNESQEDSKRSFREVLGQSQEQFLQLVNVLWRNVVDPLQETLRLARSAHARLPDREHVAPARAQLVVIGPRILAVGERTLVKGSEWTLTVDRFLGGNETTLTDFCDSFFGMSARDRFLILEAAADARELIQPPTWEKIANALRVNVVVGGSIDPQDVSTLCDIDLERTGPDGNAVRIYGGEMVERLLGRHLECQRGDWIAEETFGSFFREWAALLGDCTIEDAAHLLKCDVLRICHMPVKQFAQTRAPSLWGIERVCDVTMTNFKITDATWDVGINVILDIRGVGRREFSYSYAVARVRPERPEMPFSDEFRNRDEVLGQLTGFWAKAGSEEPTKPKRPHDGALLLERNGSDIPLGLVLHRTGKQWKPLPHSSASTLEHSAAIQRGESWSFTTYRYDGRMETRWIAEKLEPVPVDDVERLFGTQAKLRAPTDRASLSLHLRRHTG